MIHDLIRNRIISENRDALEHDEKLIEEAEQLHSDSALFKDLADKCITNAAKDEIDRISIYKYRLEEAMYGIL